MKQKLIFLALLVAPFFFATAQTPNLVGYQDLPGSYLVLAPRQNLYQQDPTVRAAFEAAHPNTPTTAIQAGVAYELYGSGIYGWDHLEQDPSGRYRVVWATGQQPPHQFQRPGDDRVRLVQPDNAQLDQLADWAAGLSQQPLTNGGGYQPANPRTGSISPSHRESKVAAWEIYDSPLGYTHPPAIKVLGQAVEEEEWTLYRLTQESPTISALAEIYGVPVQLLLDANEIEDDRTIPEGFPLWIPAQVPITVFYGEALKGFYPLYLRDLLGLSLAQQLIEFQQPGDLQAYSNILAGSGYRLMSPSFHGWVIRAYMRWHKARVADMTPTEALRFCQGLRASGLAEIRSRMLNLQADYGLDEWRIGPNKASAKIGHGF
jgi:hypothetical protein